VLPMVGLIKTLAIDPQGPVSLVSMQKGEIK